MTVHRLPPACPWGLSVSVNALVTTQPTAERLPVRTLITGGGLRRDQLACVSNDARGFVWFCTEEGLVR